MTAQRQNETFTPMLTGLGAAVYFHQHPRERWAWLADRMAEAGLSFARVGEFCWDLFEPREGAYDFHLLDEWIALLSSRGLGILLCTPTASPPDAMCLAHPEIVPVKNDGHSFGFNVRRHTCPTAPAYRDRCEGIVRALGQRYANHPAIVGWQIDNEIGHPFCYCPQCHRAFQAWLRETFGTIDAFNRQAGQDFLGRSCRSFEEVPLPASGSNPCLFQLFNRFMDRQIRECWGAQAEWLRAEGVRAPITTNVMPTWYGYDHERLFANLDVVAGDCYPHAYPAASNPFHDDQPAGLAFICAYLRGIKHGQKFGFAEMRWAPVSSDPQYPSAAELRRWTYLCLAAGADFINYFRFDTSPSGLERGLYGMIPSSGLIPPLYESFQTLADEIRRLAPDLAATEVPRAPIGILYSHLTHLALQHHTDWDLLSGPHGNGYTIHLARHFRALFENQMPADIVYPNDTFDAYRVLLAPALQVLPIDLATKLKAWVAGGGILVLSPPCGVQDEQAREWEVPNPANLDEAAGVCVDGRGVLQPRKIRLTLRAASDQPLPDVESATMINLLRAQPGTTVLATFAGPPPYDNRPALTRHAWGQGAVYMLAAMWDEPELTALYGTLLPAWGLEPAWRPPQGVSIMTRSSADRTLHFLFNPGNRAITVPFPFSATDAFSGQRLPSLDLAAGQCAVVKQIPGVP